MRRPIASPRMKRWRGHVVPVCRLCDNLAVSKGLCRLHYDARRRARAEAARQGDQHEIGGPDE